MSQEVIHINSWSGFNVCASQCGNVNIISYFCGLCIVCFWKQKNEYDMILNKQQMISIFDEKSVYVGFIACH